MSVGIKTGSSIQPIIIIHPPLVLSLFYALIFIVCVCLCFIWKLYSFYKYMKRIVMSLTWGDENIYFRFYFVLMTNTWALFKFKRKVLLMIYLFHYIYIYIYIYNVCVCVFESVILVLRESNKKWLHCYTSTLYYSTTLKKCRYLDYFCSSIFSLALTLCTFIFSFLHHFMFFLCF